MVTLSIGLDPLLGKGDAVVDGALRQLATRGGIDENQSLAYDIAHTASSLAATRACLTYAEQGVVETNLVAAFFSLALSDLAARILGRESDWNVGADWFAPFSSFVATYGAPSFLAGLAEDCGPRHLGEEFSMVSDIFHRFAAEQVRPHAERIHRTNSEIPESIVRGVTELGGFGLSVPVKYGGFSTGDAAEYVGMVIATEELSWGSLGAGGSLITRPEILTRALLHGGTEEQRTRWLPRLASAETLCAIAVTEPDFGSDVANLTTSAKKTVGGWLINGSKTWSTFAARAEVLMLLARTDPDRTLAHRGLSLFIVEKPVGDSQGFSFHQNAHSEGRSDADGRLEGRPIDTIGYRGMHSYELSFENWFLPDENLIGGDGGLGNGFYYQMSGFENGRIQTAARGIGVMQAAYEEALAYARSRKVFQREIIHFELTRVKLAKMAALIQCSRQFALAVARNLGQGDGSLEASMVKAMVCPAAEWVTREAMQIHGGMGYAEEYAVSRYFVDARVLAIFEGADETLCLKVIAKRLLDSVS